MEKRTKSLFFPFLTILIVLGVLNACTTNDWPQFRGPNNNMVIATEDMPQEWNDSLNVKWVSDLEGDSWSTPVFAANRIFVSSVVLVKAAPKKEAELQLQQTPPPGQTPPPPPQEEDKSYLEEEYRWLLTCFDASTGKELWKKTVREGHPRIKKHARNNYACETPVTDGKKVYVYFGMHGLYCYDLQGNLVWEKDPGAYETLNGWGTGSSPVLYKGVLYVLVDNEVSSFLAAYNAATGEEKWKVNRDEATSYSTPVIWKNSARSELVTIGKKARSYDPATGEMLWEMQLAGETAIPSPVFDENMIYLGMTGRRVPGTLYAVKAGASGDISLAEGEKANEWVAWSNAETGIGNPSPVLYDGLIYVLASQRGGLTCVDAATGENVYSSQVEEVGACWASPWIQNGKLLFYDEKGNTHVLKTGRSFEHLAKNTLPDTFWATVVPVKNTYVIKGVDKMYCVGK